MESLRELVDVWNSCGWTIGKFVCIGSVIFPLLFLWIVSRFERPKKKKARRRKAESTYVVPYRKAV
jgi:hypothetical protein